MFKMPRFDSKDDWPLCPVCHKPLIGHRDQRPCLTDEEELEEMFIGPLPIEEEE